MQLQLGHAQEDTPASTRAEGDTQRHRTERGAMAYGTRTSATRTSRPAENPRARGGQPPRTAETQTDLHMAMATVPGARDAAQRADLTGTDSPLDGDALNAWFNEYADTDIPDEVGPDGIERLCADVGADIESVEILYIAWRLGAQSMGVFRRDEWRSGMARIGVQNSAQLKFLVPYIRNLLLDSPQSFKALYYWTFEFAKEKETSRNIPVEIASGMWNILVPPATFPHTAKFTRFLAEKGPVQAINKDQWRSFLEFVNTINDSLTGYDESQSWPVLFDEYVYWRKEHNL